MSDSGDLSSDLRQQEPYPPRTEPPQGRGRRIWAASVVLLLSVGVAASALWWFGETWYRLNPPRFLGALCWAAATGLYIVGTVWLSRSRPLVRGLTTAALILLTGFLTFATFVLYVVDDSGQVQHVEASPDGRYEVAAQDHYRLIDPGCRVWLRESGGVFSRQFQVGEHLTADCAHVHIEFVDDTLFRVSAPEVDRQYSTERVQEH